MPVRNVFRTFVNFFSGFGQKQSDPVALARADWEQDKESGEKLEMEMKSKSHPPDYVKADGGYPEKQPKAGNLD